MKKEGKKWNLGGIFDDVDVDELAEFREQDYEQSIAAYKASQEDETVSKSKREKELARVLVPLLAMQCYHLPGNNWRQDLFQYVSNNHPIFGICLHHKLHPIGAKTRIVALVGTLVFGLALTSFFELLYIKYPSYQKTLISFGDAETGWTLTSGMLSLWTVGGGLHTAYNLFMWHIAACSCMREGGCMESAPKFCKCPNFGKTFLRIFVIVIVALTIFVVCLKVVIANDEEATLGSVTDLDNYQSADDFGFILAYLVGMALSFFLWYFLGLFVLFSGVLGCKKLPVLGGRPREVAIEEKLLAKSNTGSTNPFDDLEEPSSISKKSSKKGSSFVGSNRDDSIKRDGSAKGTPKTTKKKTKKAEVELEVAAASPTKKKPKKKTEAEPEVAAATPNKKTPKKKTKAETEVASSPAMKKPGKKKKISGDIEESPAKREMGKKQTSTRQKKKEEGRMNSSKLVFQPL